MTTWRDYPSVVSLSDFIRDNKDSGFYLVEKNSSPCLKITPGLKSRRDPRWETAEQATQLFLAAGKDLQKLIKRKILKLQKHMG